MPPVTRAAVPRARAGDSPKPRKAPRQARDGERTRATILEVATAEFARHGFAGARVERITGAARINDRMLYYYFGSKEKLFVEVLEQAYGDLRTFEEGLNLMTLSPVDAIRKLLYANWTYYQQHPEFISLVANENLYLAAHLKRSARAKNLALPIVTILEKIVAQGVSAGVFRDGIDVVNLYIAIAGFNYFYLSNQYTLSAVLKTDLSQARAREKWRETIEDFVFRFLLADPSQVTHLLAAPRRA